MQSNQIPIPAPLSPYTPGLPKAVMPICSRGWRVWSVHNALMASMPGWPATARIAGPPAPVSTAKLHSVKFASSAETMQRSTHATLRCRRIISNGAVHALQKAVALAPRDWGARSRTKESSSRSSYVRARRGGSYPCLRSEPLEFIIKMGQKHLGNYLVFWDRAPCNPVTK